MKDLIPNIRALNFWTLKQKIKDHTIQRTSTIKLLQQTDVIKWNNPADLNVNHRMLSLLLSAKVQSNPNIRFKYNHAQAKDRYVKRHGQLRKTTGEMKSHSFVKQFLQQMELSIAHAASVASDSVTIKDTSNADNLIAFATAAANTYWALEAPANTSTYGIQIGTGVTAPATADYTVETQIAHGVGAGQMQYGATGVCAAAVVGANMDLVIARPFTNSSGDSITVKEITAVFSTQGKYNLGAHDAVNQAVANGESLVVTYVMRTTV